jgi:hypothetical protein
MGNQRGYEQSHRRQDGAAKEIGEPLVGLVFGEVTGLRCRLGVPCEAEDSVRLREIAKYRRERDDVAYKEPGVLTEATNLAANGRIAHDPLACVVHEAPPDLSAATVDDERAPVRFSKYGDAAGRQHPVELPQHEARVADVLKGPISPYAVDAPRRQGQHVRVPRDESRAPRRPIGSRREHPLIKVESDYQAVGSHEVGHVLQVRCWATTDVHGAGTRRKAHLGEDVRLVGNCRWRARNLQHVVDGVRSSRFHG